MTRSQAPFPNLTLLERFRMRWKRRRLLWRAWRARKSLRAVRVAPIPQQGVLAFTVLRNEITRLPAFLEFYRARGVAHFLVVDNGSDDGSAAFLAAQPDVSLWHTDAGYRAARFGVDWSIWLQTRYGHGRWCLTVDADELLVYDGDDQYDLNDLTGYLARCGQDGFGALMLDIYPEGRLGDGSSDDPLSVLTHFDPGPYRAARQRPMGNLWVQGGVRERVFFAGTPRRSPTLNKIPLVRWCRGYVHANSTHSLLPPRLNGLYDGPGDPRPSGVLLHTKFLPEIVEKSAIEKDRAQHFHTPALFDPYYDAIAARPVLHTAASVRYRGSETLIHAGLMPKIPWNEAGDSQTR